MARKRKRKTKISAYTRNRNRIKRYINNLKKKGLTVDIYFPTQNELRKQGVVGTELTKLTRILKSITPEYLKSVATPIEPEPERGPSEDDMFFYRTIISDFQYNLDSFENGEAYEMIKLWFNQVLRDNGIENTAIMLQQGYENGIMLTWEVVYKADRAREFIAEMMDYIPDSGILYKEQMLDKYQFMSELDRAMEESDGWDEPD